MAIDAVEFPLNARRLGPSVEAALTILTNFTGNEVINENRSQKRRVFNAAFGVRTLADLRILSAFFHVMAGTGFLVKDWTDFQATRTTTTLTSSPVTVSTQGTATVTTGVIWQLQKKYTVASRIHTRNVKRPKSGTVSVYFDGTLKTETTHYTIDYATGLLTVVSGSPTAITWTGEFYVPCRFAQKNLPADLLMYRADGTGNTDVPDVPMIELL